MVVKAPSSRPQRIDLVFRAFADRTRLRLLCLLRDGELCVCDLVDALGVPQPRVSRHLAYLRAAGLVVARKDGLWAYYGLAPARDPLHKKLLECVTTCFNDVPELARDRKRLGMARCSSKGATKCCP